MGSLQLWLFITKIDPKKQHCARLTLYSSSSSSSWSSSFVRLLMKEGRKEEKRERKRESMQRHWRSWQAQRIPDEKDKTCTPNSETHATSRLLHRLCNEGRKIAHYSEIRGALSLSLFLAFSLSLSLSLRRRSSVILSKVHKMGTSPRAPNFSSKRKAAALSLLFFDLLHPPHIDLAAPFCPFVNPPRYFSSLALSVRDRRETTERYTHCTSA